MPEYVFDNAGKQASGRFTALEELFDSVTFRYLAACGVSDGWRCLEVGGGSGSIGRWLGEQVGTVGKVVVTDIDTRFLDGVASANVEVREHNIVSDPLEESAYDLVHTRLVLNHLPQRSVALERMLAALKPDGWMVLQEFDVSLYADPSRFPSEHLLKTLPVLDRVMSERGVNQRLGRELAGIVSALGLKEIEVEGHVTLFRGGAAGARFVRAGFEQLREPILASGGVTAEEFEEDLARLDDPKITWPSAILWTVRGRKP